MKGNMDSSFIASRSGIDVKRRDERRRNQVEHTQMFLRTRKREMVTFTAAGD